MLPVHVDASLFKKLPALVTVAGDHPGQIPVRSPYDSAELGCVPNGSDRDVELAVARARAFQPKWASLPASDRARIFLRFHDLLLKRQDEVLDLIQLETGKARRHAFEEVLDTAVVCRYYARRAASLLRPRRRRGALPFLTRTWEVRSPVGVVGFFVPWNYPLNLAITDAVPALLAGNTAVIKPEPQTSFTALWAVRLLQEAGLPADALTVVTGEGAVLGPSLARRADFLMFTGSTRVGRIVGQQAAERLVGCSLELGGKNPMIVMADADLDRVVHGAVHGCFVGAGQVCVSIERIYVHETRFEEFVEQFADLTRALKLGAALNYTMDVGSLTSQRQLETVEAHVRDAIDKGAILVAGGQRREDLGPLFYEPTILTNVQDDMTLFAQETFGPVVAVYSFRDETEAIARANDTSYGLNASIWTRSVRRGIELARQIRSGSVNINEVYAATWGSVDSPFGGMKDSGLGARHGAEGLLKYTHSQTIAAQRILPIGPARGVSPAKHAHWMTRLVKIVRHTPLMG